MRRGREARRFSWSAWRARAASPRRPSPACGETAVVIGGASAASAPCATPGDDAPQPILKRRSCELAAPSTRCAATSRAAATESRSPPCAPEVSRGISRRLPPRCLPRANLRAPWLLVGVGRRRERRVAARPKAPMSASRAWRAARRAPPPTCAASPTARPYDVHSAPLSRWVSESGRGRAGGVARRTRLRWRRRRSGDE